MLTRLFALALFAASPLALAQSPAADGLQEGREYTVLEPAQPTADKSKVEVLEVFGYWCIHCAHLDPVLEKWKKGIPSDVDFRYVPAIWQGGIDEFFARAFYTAETMGVLDTTHSAMFTAAAVDRKLQSTDDILDFYADQGVNREQFEATMNSFTVNAKVNRVKQSLPRYAIEGTPTLIINGKYKVMARQGMTMEDVMSVVDKLIARERAAMKQG
ncbi:thiol:disulfide interchange protein DsbA/DsbL [Pseudomarimonas salicorniae]|uniref:Thiol:disulfide interchange protein n=1 Tax=Pseudomarimonas salicorniae TaxID=2933270 RepID=A0ABT0GFQ9_9GAMM|nr:thiol:disulfide interchange protein DsbA/DsbL [Lysobacter sp. CAU 1642]MCK7593371.1 thiol:disulfide interchange protein DsbA/DsbL [Lysobacter sp. CAU 1642]